MGIFVVEHVVWVIAFRVHPEENVILFRPTQEKSRALQPAFLQPGLRCEGVECLFVPGRQDNDGSAGIHSQPGKGLLKNGTDSLKLVRYFSRLLLITVGDQEEM